MRKERNCRYGNENTAPQAVGSTLTERVQILRGKRSNGETRYVVVSHVRDKSIEKIKTNIKRYLYDMQHPLEGKRTQYQAICRYNSFVVGIHEYYSLATKVCDDFGPFALAVHKSLQARFRKKVKTAKQAKKKNLPCDIPKYVAEKYGKSKQMRYGKTEAMSRRQAILSFLIGKATEKPTM